MMVTRALCQAVGPAAAPADAWGIVRRADDGGPGSIPFIIADDSVSQFIGDDEGIIAETKLDNVFAAVDLDNNQNPSGTAQAVWTFDITGRSNIEMSIDLGMIGDFELTEDVYNFSYSIDGGASLPAFSLAALEGVAYAVTMDVGTVFDRTANGFFDENEYQSVLDFGEDPDSGLFYHVADVGGDPGGVDPAVDDVAQDGIIPVEFGGGFEEIRGYRVVNGFGTFDQNEFDPFKDPLGVTTGDGALTQLTNDLQNITTSIVGTGTTLTLTLDAAGNGGSEGLVFDNILLSEDDGPGLMSDFNGDGTVDLLDLDILGANFGLDPATMAEGDANGDGVVDLLDLDILGVEFGSGGEGSAVPEPGSLAMLALAMGAFAASRRR